jgi:hypothetical protein
MVFVPGFSFNAIGNAMQFLILLADMLDSSFEKFFDKGSMAMQQLNKWETATVITPRAAPISMKVE